MEQERGPAPGPGFASFEKTHFAVWGFYHDFEIGIGFIEQDPGILLRQHELHQDFQQDRPSALQE